jgi:hypothetical protein
MQSETVCPRSPCSVKERKMVACFMIKLLCTNCTPVFGRRCTGHKGGNQHEDDKKTDNDIPITLFRTPYSFCEDDG